MNYLAHLYLSDDDELMRLGNLMGDFVKGRLIGAHPPLIEAGIWQHRVVDSYAHTHPVYKTSWQRLDSSLKHVRPLLIDIFYDHFLAKNWSQLHATPLTDFSQQVYASLERNMDLLPAAMQPVARRMIDLDWLTSYAHMDTVDLVLERMSRRFRRPVDLTPGSEQLRKHYDALQQDFVSFIHEAKLSIPEETLKRTHDR